MKGAIGEPFVKIIKNAKSIKKMMIGIKMNFFLSKINSKNSLRKSIIKIVI